MKKALSLLSRNPLLSGENGTFIQHIGQGVNTAVKGFPEEVAFRQVHFLAE